MSSSSASFSGTVGYDPTNLPDAWVTVAGPQIRYNIKKDLILGSAVVTLSPPSATFASIPTNFNNPFLSATLLNGFLAFGNSVSSTTAIQSYTVGQSSLTMNFQGPLLSLDATSTPVFYVKLGKQALDAALAGFYTYSSTIAEKGYIVNPTSATGTLVNPIYLPTNISSSRSFTIGTTLPVTITPTEKGVFSFSTVYTAGDLISYPDASGSLFMCVAGPDYRGSNYSGISSIHPLNPPGASMYWTLVTYRGFATWTFDPTNDLLLQPAYYPNASTIYWLNSSEPAPDAGLPLAPSLLQGFQLFGSTILQDTFINSFQYGSMGVTLTYGFQTSANTNISTLDTPVYVRGGRPPFEAAIVAAESQFNAGLNVAGLLRDPVTQQIVVKPSLLPFEVSSFSSFTAGMTTVTPSNVTLYTYKDIYTLGSLVAYPTLADSTYICSAAYRTIQNSPPLNTFPSVADSIQWITNPGIVALDSQTISYAGEVSEYTNRVAYANKCFVGPVLFTFTIVQIMHAFIGFSLSPSPQSEEDLYIGITVNAITNTITARPTFSVSYTNGTVVTMLYDPQSATVRITVDGILLDTFPATQTTPLTPMFCMLTQHTSVTNVRAFSIPYFHGPLSVFGAQGDFSYSTCSLYQKSSSSWDPACTFQFSTLSKRTLGIPALVAGIPTQPADTADYAVNVLNKDLYQYNGTEWKSIAHLTFPIANTLYISPSYVSTLVTGDYTIDPSDDAVSQFSYTPASISSVVSFLVPSNLSTSGFFYDGSNIGYTLGNNTIQRIATNGSISTLNFYGPGSNVSSLAYIAPGSNGYAYVTDIGLKQIKKVTLATGFISTVAISTFTTPFVSPAGIAVGSNETLYVADSGDNTIRMISSANMTVFAGISGTSSFVNGLRIPLNPDSSPVPPPPGSLFPQFGELRTLFQAKDFVAGSPYWTDESGFLNNAVSYDANNSIVQTVLNSDSTGIQFDGSRFMRFPNPGSMSNWTFSAWFKQTANIQGRNIVTEESPGAYLNMVIGGTPFSGNAIGSALYINGQWIPSATLPAIQSNVWTHIGFTWDGTTMLGYVNGSNVASNTPVPSNYPFPIVSQANRVEDPYIIGGNWSDPSSHDKLIGELGELRIVNRAIFPIEMGQLYLNSASNYSATGINSNVTLFSPTVLLNALDYNGTGTWVDTTGHGFNATTTGTIAMNTDQNGMLFNGTTSWSFANPGLGNAFTASIWAKLTQPISASASLFENISNPSTGASQFHIYSQTGAIPANRLGVEVFTTSSVSVPDTLVTSLPSAWHQYIVTWNGATLSWYIDGSIFSSVTPTSPPILSSNGLPFRIGSSNFVGEVGEVRLYNSALTPYQISFLYTQTSQNFVWSPSNLANLYLWLDASDTNSVATSGSNVTQWSDKSGNSNHFVVRSGKSAPSYTGLHTPILYKYPSSTPNTGIQFSGSNNCMISQKNATLAAGDHIFFVGHTQPNQTSIFTILLEFSGTYLSIFTTKDGDINTWVTTYGDSNNIGGNTPFTINGLSNTHTLLTSPCMINTSVVNGRTGKLCLSTDVFGPDRYFIGTMQEILVLKAPVSINQIQAVQGYLGWKWGFQNSFLSLPTSFPYRSSSPSYREVAIPALLLLKASNYDQSGSWKDESGNGKNTTGSIQRNAASNGISFNGTSPLSLSNIGAGTQWTVAFWYKHKGSPLSTPSSLFSQATDSSGNTTLSIVYTGTNTIAGGFYRTSTFLRGPSITLQLNGWTHLAFTYDGTTLYTYVNSFLVGVTLLTQPTLGTGTTYSIGGSCVGELGDLRVFQGICSQRSIQFLYANTYPGYTTPAIRGTFSRPTHLALDAAGDNLFVSDTGNNAIRKLPLIQNSVLTYPGSQQQPFSTPLFILCDVSGNIYVADTGNDVISKIQTNGTITTVQRGANAVALRAKSMAFNASGALVWTGPSLTVSSNYSLFTNAPEIFSTTVILPLSSAPSYAMDWAPSTGIAPFKTSILYQVGPTTQTPSFIYSNTFFTTPFSLQFQLQTGGQVAAFVTTNPMNLSSSIYYSIQVAANTTISVVESGLQKGTFGTSWTAATVFQISVTATTVTYSMNGTPFSTSSVEISQNSSFQCAFQTSVKGSIVNGVLFQSSIPGTATLWHPVEALDFSTAVALAPSPNTSDTQSGSNWFVSAPNSSIYALGNSVFDGYEVWGPDFGFARIVSYYFSPTTPSGESPQSIYILLDKSIQGTFIRGTHYILRASSLLSSLVTDSASGLLVYNSSILPKAILDYQPIPLGDQAVNPRNRGIWDAETEYFLGDLVYHPTLADTLYFCAVPYHATKGISPASNSAVWSSIINLLDAVELHPALNASDIQSGPNWFVSAPNEQLYKMGTAALNGKQIWCADFGYATITNCFFNYTSPSNQDPHSIYITVNKDISTSFRRGPHYILAISGMNPLVFLKAANYTTGSATWSDQSGHRHDATLATGTKKKNAAGNGIILDGTSYWTFSDVAAGASWTAAVWFKETAAPIQPGNSAQILTQRSVNLASPDSLNIRLGYSNTSTGITGGFYTNAFYTTTPPYGMIRNAWTHLVVTYDGTTIRHYVNGNSVGSYTTTGTTSSTNGCEYRIGRRWDTEDYMVGEIGEVRIYGAAMTPTQVTTLYGVTVAEYPNPPALTISPPSGSYTSASSFTL